MESDALDQPIAASGESVEASVNRWIEVAAKSHPGIEPFEQAVTALVAIGTSSIPALIEAVADPRFEVRALSVTVLGTLKDIVAFEPLVDRLADRDFRIRRKAAIALGRLGDARAIPALLAVARSESGKSSRTTRPPSRPSSFESSSVLKTYGRFVATTTSPTIPTAPML